MKITPTHNAVWAYAEWCADHGQRFPKLRAVANDLARPEREVRRAFSDLENWGVLACRGSRGHGRIVRLGDGRETAGERRA